MKPKFNGYKFIHESIHDGTRITKRMPDGMDCSTLIQEFCRFLLDVSYHQDTIVSALEATLEEYQHEEKE